MFPFMNAYYSQQKLANNTRYDVFYPVAHLMGHELTTVNHSHEYAQKNTTAQIISHFCGSTNTDC